MRRIGAIEVRAEGITSLSKTSVKNVVVAALLDGHLISPYGPDSRADIAEGFRTPSSIKLLLLHYSLP
jgi:hypothetical protein